MNLIKGKQAIREALEDGVVLDRIIVSHSAADHFDIQNLKHKAKLQGVKMHVISKEAFTEQYPDADRVQVIAYVQPENTLSLESLDPKKHPVVVAFDHLEDPHNMGAILRTCYALGIQAVVYPKDRQCQISPGVINASAGAAKHIGLIKVTNIVQSLTQLKNKGYWIYGASSKEGVSLEKCSFNTPMVLVMGNEHKGLSRLAINTLDEQVHIPLINDFDSLNVSVAAGIILYTISQKVFHE